MHLSSCKMLLLGAVLTGATKPVLAAALVWENGVVELSVQPEQREARGEFRFHNNGNRAIKMVSLETSCRCTSAEMPKRSYLPGESGVLTAVFSVDGLTGFQEKTLTVKTDEPNSDPVRLALRLTIKTYMTIQPSLVYWSGSGLRSEATITCTKGNTQAINVLRAHCDQVNIMTQVETIEAGRKYVVHVRPSPSAGPESGFIRLYADVEGVGERQFMAYATIK
jgi:hypothetical protein